jgi:DNA ligase D-like protein (predicted polymerase)
VASRPKTAAEPDLTLEVGGRSVLVTHPSKMLIAAAKVTKLDLVRYHVAVAEGALRGAGGRPCVLVRYPDGIEGDFFFQKRAPASRPEELEVATIRFPSGRTAEEVVPRHAADLAWMANLACLEFHPHPVRADDLDHPDELRIDLDPVPGVEWPQIRQVAAVVREALAEVGLEGWPKTSGSRGLHVLVRIERRWAFDQVRRAALAVARDVERRLPGLATSAWWKEERQGVFLDYNQNAKDRTVASAYSVRPKPDARVSMPIRWDDLDACDPADFTLWTVPGLLQATADAHAAIDGHGASLERLLELSARQERDGLGDAPWPPHYRKAEGEPKRAPPSTARSDGSTPRPRAPRTRAPLLEVSRAGREADAIAAAESWKARHPEVAAHLSPADTLVDRMRGSSSVIWRVRINLARVPAALRPAQTPAGTEPAQAGAGCSATAVSGVVTGPRPLKRSSAR